MYVTENQFEIDSYFLIAKSRNKEISKNIHDYMFMYKKENELYFKNRNTKKLCNCYLLIIMDSEILKWIEQAPKHIKLSAHKECFYNGQLQLKLFFKLLEK